MKTLAIVAAFMLTGCQSPVRTTYAQEYSRGGGPLPETRTEGLDAQWDEYKVFRVDQYPDGSRKVTTVLDVKLPKVTK